ncbi:MAG: hypothetical protein Q7K28_02050 [Candidatus Wildermuthbacteria bacterium]|nr:hypothetical protein [Candidatus Wildermuthbacteria bacterium]
MLVGHQKQRQYLQRLAKLGKIPHALLFAGPEMVGKRMVALEFAKFLIGEEFRKELHPDLIIVEPEYLPKEAKEDPLVRGEEIKIAQIRDLIWKLSLRPYSAPLKVAIINDAHLMTKDSQNCLLKTLEEPTNTTILILISEFPEALLPTIFSRCQFIKFFPVPKEEIEKYIRETGKIDGQKRVEEISRLAAGRPGLAAEILSEPRKLEDLRTELTELAEKDLLARFQYAKALAEKDDLREILSAWQSLLREFLLVSLRSRAKGIFSVLKLKNILSQMQNIIFLIQNTNINQRLALEALMLEL